MTKSKSKRVEPSKLSSEISLTPEKKKALLEALKESRLKTERLQESRRVEPYILVQPMTV